MEHNSSLDDMMNLLMEDTIPVPNALMGKEDISEKAKLVFALF